MADISYPSYLFSEGTNYCAYEFLGVSLDISDGEFIYTFRVWAPNALQVGLISDFSGWEHPLFMTKVTSDGIFELVYRSKYSLERKPYKYRVFTEKGIFDKGDPYAAFSRGGCDGASLIFAEKHYQWSDSEWMRGRQSKLFGDGEYLSVPINIYELHLGSFIRHFDNRYYSYTELADFLPSYLKEMGYTHVEFLPIQEYPFDGSWGYQVCGFFAPSSRFGDPDEFRHLVDALHSAGIGVILDWVCAHFPADSWGISQFDGSYLYEYSDPERRKALYWDTSLFDVSRPEVRSFLISNALYLLREFHVDGLRVDATSSILYLKGGEVNPYGISFFKQLNLAITSEFPDVMVIAEESADYRGLTAPISEGGLGFTMKWNMGWSHDFLDYVAEDPMYRKYKHNALTFPLVYAFNERYCMTISHDDVSRGKKSFVDKMYGNYEDKLAMARLSLMLMMTYPGKKLLFMGAEFAQFKEWDYDCELEWFMLDFPKHKEFRDYVSALNHFYLRTPELWQKDFTKDGFSWIYGDKNEQNLIVYKRISRYGGEITVILNFSGIDQAVTVPANSSGNYEVIFDTGNLVGGKYINISHSDNDYYANIHLAKYSGIIIKKNYF